jgi:hypothetical protein
VSQKDTCEGLAALQTSMVLTQLAELLRLPRPFNICTALGLGRQELRHSELLAYLLDPRQPHGLGNRVAQALLHRVALFGASIFDVDELKLDGLEVRREWEHIDILLVSPHDQIVVVIENKIDSDEHSNQLKRYYETAIKRYPDWRIIGIYLTLYGIEPADTIDRERYMTLSYNDVAQVLHEVSVSPIMPDVATLLRHYIQLVRSKLVPDPDSDQAHLARTLYRDHRAAISVAMAEGDARQRMIQRHFDRLLDQTNSQAVQPLDQNRYYINSQFARKQTRFVPPHWHRPELQVSDEWTQSRLVMLFQFIHDPNEIWLVLTVGPAKEAEPLRRALHHLALQQHAPFTPWAEDPAAQWFGIYGRTVFAHDSSYFINASDAQIQTAISDSWQAFLNNDLPLIVNTINTEILSRDWSSTS